MGLSPSTGESGNRRSPPRRQSWTRFSDQACPAASAPRSGGAGGPILRSLVGRLLSLGLGAARGRQAPGSGAHRTGLTHPPRPLTSPSAPRAQRLGTGTLLQWWAAPQNLGSVHSALETAGWGGRRQLHPRPSPPPDAPRPATMQSPGPGPRRTSGQGAGLRGLSRHTGSPTLSLTGAPGRCMWGAASAGGRVLRVLVRSGGGATAPGSWGRGAAAGGEGRGVSRQLEASQLHRKMLGKTPPMGPWRAGSPRGGSQGDLPFDLQAAAPTSPHGPRDVPITGVLVDSRGGKLVSGVGSCTFTGKKAQHSHGERGDRGVPQVRCTKGLLPTGAAQAPPGPGGVPGACVPALPVHCAVCPAGLCSGCWGCLRPPVQGPRPLGLRPGQGCNPPTPRLSRASSGRFQRGHVAP